MTELEQRLERARHEYAIYVDWLYEERKAEFDRLICAIKAERDRVCQDVPSRDDAARAIEDRIKASPMLPILPGQIGRPFDATMHDLADAVLALLPGRTEAEVKAEALRDLAYEFLDWDVVYGHDKASPEIEESHRISAYILCRADGIDPRGV